jgi:hypothetical protein
MKTMIKCVFAYNQKIASDWSDDRFARQLVFIPHIDR